MLKAHQSPDLQTAKKTSVKSIIQSVIASAFGVQKKANYVRDFSEGKPAHFIIAGCVATILFILLLAGLVNLAIQFYR